jgi:hypothetical protein
MTRRPAERVMLAQLREDAWKFDKPHERERIFKECLMVPGRFDAFELNVLYEILLIGSTAENLQDELEMCPEGEVCMGHIILTDSRLAMPDKGKAFQVETLPFALARGVCALLDDPNWVEPEPWSDVWAEWSKSLGHGGEALAKGMVMAWREWTATMRRIWPDWSDPRAYTTLLHICQRRVHTFYGEDAAHAAMQPLVTLCETLLRLCWLYECEARDVLSFGPASDRRLPDDEAERAILLRRYAEQQPELRREPAFVHVAPREASDWLRPKDYASLPILPTTPEQLSAILRDAFANRRYVHDHVAVIEVDRKPIKSIVLAPELLQPMKDIIFLTAMVNHEKGSFACEVLIRFDRDEDDPNLIINPRIALSLPFGSHAWRMLPDNGEHESRLRNSRGMLPPDEHVAAVIIAAWRDLIVANVREEQYEQAVIRGGGGRLNERRPARAQKRHTRVVRYLPRTVVIRRAIEAQRVADPHGPKRELSIAFRVGTFARRLQPGHHRSRMADDYAKLIGMPLREDQTVVQPHIRGGTEEERQALLAQDDVRLWRSWAAIDLLYAS